MTLPTILRRTASALAFTITYVGLIGMGMELDNQNNAHMLEQYKKADPAKRNRMMECAARPALLCLNGMPVRKSNYEKLLQGYKAIDADSQTYPR